MDIQTHPRQQKKVPKISFLNTLFPNKTRRCCPTLSHDAPSMVTTATQDETRLNPQLARVCRTKTLVKHVKPSNRQILIVRWGVEKEQVHNFIQMSGKGRVRYICVNHSCQFLSQEHQFVGCFLIFSIQQIVHSPVSIMLYSRDICTKTSL